MYSLEAQAGRFGSLRQKSAYCIYGENFKNFTYVKGFYGTTKPYYATNILQT